MGGGARERGDGDGEAAAVRAVRRLVERLHRRAEGASQERFVPGTGHARADGGTKYAAEIAQLIGTVAQVVPVDEAAVGAEHGGDALDPIGPGERAQGRLVLGGECGGGALEEAGTAEVWVAGDILGRESADVLDEEREQAVVAVRHAPVAAIRQAIAVVRAAGRTANLLGGDEAVAFEGHEVLTHGHGGETDGGRQFVDGGAVGALEEGEDLVLG